MTAFDFGGRWLANAAVGGLIVLALGSLAAKLFRQPVRRARIIVLTLLGAFAVPWLSPLPIAPKWSAGFALADPTLGGPTSGGSRPVMRVLHRWNRWSCPNRHSCARGPLHESQGRESAPHSQQSK